MMSCTPSEQYPSRNMEEAKPELKEEHQVSSAYIRSLVKQLSSSRGQDGTSLNTSKDVPADDLSEHNSKRSKCLGANQAQPQNSQRPKKQVRRRLHTSKPYQERVLNMAEARKEIVTALKLHRATMRANELKQHQQQLAQSSKFPLSSLAREEFDFSIYPPAYTSFSCCQANPFSSLSSPFGLNYPSVAPFSISENMNFQLPHQPLGLNLNLQGFNNIDSSLFIVNNSNKAPTHESTPATSSSYPSSISKLGNEVESISSKCNQQFQVLDEQESMSLHPVVDDEGMAHIQSIGKQHDMEWSDKINLVTSARWSKFIEGMEGSQDQIKGEVDHPEVSHSFDDIFDLPAMLLDGAQGSFEENYLSHEWDFNDYYHADGYQRDISLPCLDIGEIGGLDGDWQ